MELPYIKKLGNSKPVAIKNYIDVSFAVMAEEVGNFLNKVQEKAIHKGRIYAKNIDVNIFFIVFL